MRPHLEFAIASWSPCLGSDIESPKDGLDRLQLEPSTARPKTRDLSENKSNVSLSETASPDPAFSPIESRQRGIVWLDKSKERITNHFKEMMNKQANFDSLYFPLFFNSIDQIISLFTHPRWANHWLKSNKIVQIHAGANVYATNVKYFTRRWHAKEEEECYYAILLDSLQNQTGFLKKVPTKIMPSLKSQ